MTLNRLNLGDTIGVVALAGFERRDIIDKHINLIKSLGFKIKLGKNIYDRYGFLAGNDKDRASSLMDMFEDSKVKMILALRGGYGTMRILDLLDYDIIKENSKIFMGFSDITTLLNYINKRCDMVTFHGPMVTSNLSDEYTLKSFLSTILAPRKSYFLENPDYLALECSVNGICQGEIVGGNLCMLCSTLGTTYEVDTKNKILFLEEINESPYKIDRMLTQLIHAGKLQGCTGFILGQFKDCGLKNYEKSFTLPEVLEDRIFSFKKPTMSHFMSGHANPKITIPIGAKVNLDCNRGTIEVLEPVVK